MKKIKNIRELRDEKMRLRIRQLELEKEIKRTWAGIKEDFQIVTFLKDRLSDITPKEISEKGFLSSTLSHGAAYLTRQFVNNTGEKIETQVQQGVETLVEKIETLFGKKKA